MYTVTTIFFYFSTFLIPKELYIKKDHDSFLSYTKHYLSVKNYELTMMST